MSIRRACKVDGRYLWVGRRRFSKGRAYARSPRPVFFSSGKNGTQGKRGRFEFWSIITPTNQALTGRVRVGHDPGKRFRAVLAEPEDAEHHNQVLRSRYLLPSPRALVIKWLIQHPNHKRYAAGLKGFVRART